MHPFLRPRNARFWVFINLSWAKLTLRQSHSLSHHASNKTDEGYSYESTTWTLEGRRVVRDWTDGGRDCDGRYSSTCSQVCHVSDLHAEPAHDDGTTTAYLNGQHIHRPVWEDADDTLVFDEFAEAAGY